MKPENFARQKLMRWAATLAILALGACCTLFGVRTLRAFDHERERSHFQQRCDRFQDRLRNQIQDAVQMAHAFDGLLGASENVTPREWSNFVMRLNLAQRAPGVIDITIAELPETGSLQPTYFSAPIGLPPTWTFDGGADLTTPARESLLTGHTHLASAAGASVLIVPFMTAEHQPERVAVISFNAHALISDTDTPLDTELHVESFEPVPCDARMHEPAVIDPATRTAVVPVVFESAHWLVRVTDTSELSSASAWPLVAMLGVTGTVLLATVLWVALVSRERHSVLATARARSEARAKTAMVAAQDASHAKSSFLARMSHEIRTPMTAILGYTDLLGEDLDNPATRSEHIRTIRRNGEYLLTLINDVLDLSKIESGDMTIEHLPANVNALIDEVVTLLRPRAAVKGIALRAQHTYPFPRTIITDPMRLRQILINLVGNALKFTAEGRVVVAARYLQNPAAMVIEVSDTGIGMSQEQISRLFIPFQQADVSTARQFGGTGLGLTIARQFANLLHGDIRVESSPGKGTTFSLDLSLDGQNLTLDHAPPPASALSSVPTPTSELAIYSAAATMHPPLVADHATRDTNEAGTPRPAATGEAAHETTGRTPSLPLHSLCVLVAEDGPDNQRLIRHVLERAGATVTIVENGVLALNEALANTYHLILMDMHMPELDGYQATSSLRARGYTGPIVALTAAAMSGDREQCLSVGCNDYLTKPIDRAQIISKCAAYAPALRKAA